MAHFAAQELSRFCAVTEGVRQCFLSGVAEPRQAEGLGLVVISLFFRFSRKSYRPAPNEFRTVAHLQQHIKTEIFEIIRVRFRPPFSNQW
jgi:hypothetical protein